MKHLAIITLAAALCGCVSEYTGSSIVVGEQLALPEVSDASDDLTVRVYETIKGAKIYTRKDNAVTVEYTNAYTNTYFGIVKSEDSMTLKVVVEPTEDDEVVETAEQ